MTKQELDEKKFLFYAELWHITRMTQVRVAQLALLKELKKQGIDGHEILEHFRYTRKGKQNEDKKHDVVLYSGSAIAGSIAEHQHPGINYATETSIGYRDSGEVSGVKGREDGAGQGESVKAGSGHGDSQARAKVHGCTLSEETNRGWNELRGNLAAIHLGRNKPPNFLGG